MEPGFRRTQSLRYPRGVSNVPANGIKRARPSFRSKSSRGRPEGGSSSLSRMTFTQKQALVSSWRVLKSQAHSLMRKILTDLETASPKVKDVSSYSPKKTRNNNFRFSTKQHLLIVSSTRNQKEVQPWMNISNCSFSSSTISSTT